MYNFLDGLFIFVFFITLLCYNPDEYKVLYLTKKEGKGMSKRIVVPVDGSKIAQNALEFAITMARAYGDEIKVINIQPNLQILGEIIIKEAIAILEKAQIPYSSNIRIGTPSIEIATEAKSNEVRCIVMGTRGMSVESIESRQKLGSVSQATLSISPCPIMFVPN